MVELPAQLRIKENVQRLGDISVTLRRCAEHHLAGSCTDFLCGLNHAPLEKELLSTYEWVIRHSETCHMQSSCRNSKCLLGHVCQLPPCEYRGGSMPCRISPSLHFDDYAADRLESSDGPNPFDSVAATRTVHRQTSNAGSLHRTLSRRNSEPGGLGRTISARQSGSGSFVSRQSSTASKASQVSWDEEDEFDHVLQSISSELGRQVTLIRRTSPGSNVKQMFTSNGRARRDARHDMKKRLQSFQSRVRANLGMSDVKRQTSPSGHVSSQYLETRGKSNVLVAGRGTH